MQQPQTQSKTKKVSSNPTTPPSSRLLRHQKLLLLTLHWSGRRQNFLKKHIRLQEEFSKVLKKDTTKYAPSSNQLATYSVLYEAQKQVRKSALAQPTSCLITSAQKVRTSQKMKDRSLSREKKTLAESKSKRDFKVKCMKIDLQ